MLRPWIDVGRVGTLALNVLERHLGAVELGRLARPGTYLDFTRERPRMRIVDGRRRLSTPNTVVRFAKTAATATSSSCTCESRTRWPRTTPTPS